MNELNTDIAILTETKITSNRHARHGFGYNVFTSLAAGPQKGGVALVWRSTLAHWNLEGMRAISPNSVSATLVSGNCHWLLLGMYLTPNEPPDVELNTLEDKHQHNQFLPVITVSNLNANLDNLTDAQSTAIATTMQLLGVEDCIALFPQKNCWHCTQNWRMQDGTHQQSQCDYAMANSNVPNKSICIVIPPHSNQSLGCENTNS